MGAEAGHCLVSALSVFRDHSAPRVRFFLPPSPGRSHGAGTGRAVSGFPIGYISPNF